MPELGFKRQFKNIKGLENKTFIINFKLDYNKQGSLKFHNDYNKHFDVGDYDILLDKVFDDFTESQFNNYDNGIFLLSVCKYIVDNIPELYSINIDSKNMIDTYYKNDIINDYNKISNRYNNE